MQLFFHFTDQAVISCRDIAAPEHAAPAEAGKLQNGCSCCPPQRDLAAAPHLWDVFPRISSSGVCGSTLCCQHHICRRNLTANRKQGEPQEVIAQHVLANIKRFLSNDLEAMYLHLQY